MTKLTLVSHALCPYVQRAAILLAEKGITFDRVDIDLANKPDWFLKISPLGKVPLLRVERDGEDEAIIFESAAIVEYLDETEAPQLHSTDPIVRAQTRGWVEFGAAVLADIWRLYNVDDDAGVKAESKTLEARFALLEAEFGDGPWFAGEEFGLVDIAFAPVFRYFDRFDAIEDFGILDGKPKLQGWRARLAGRASVKGAVGEDYDKNLAEFIVMRGGELARRQSAVPA